MSTSKDAEATYFLGEESKDLVFFAGLSETTAVDPRPRTESESDDFSVSALAPADAALPALKNVLMSFGGMVNQMTSL